jgi:hypothetical protein
MAKRARKSRRPGSAKRSREVKRGDLPASRARAAGGDRKRPRTRPGGPQKRTHPPVSVSGRKELDRVEETLAAVDDARRGARRP